jgi:hypothetical protein
MAASTFGKIVQGAVIGACSALGSALMGPVGTIGGIVVGKMIIGAALEGDASSEVSVASAESDAVDESGFFDSLVG